MDPRALIVVVLAVGCRPAAGLPPIDPSQMALDPTEHKFSQANGSSDDYFGHAGAGAGDVNGDGYDDVVIGAYHNVGGPGDAFVFYGGPAGIDLPSQTRLRAADGDNDDQFGWSVTGADLDGDGYSEVIVGAKQEGVRSGAVYLYDGSAGGVDAASEFKFRPSDSELFDEFGSDVSAGGDIDGDGYPDLVVGACCDGDNGANSGAAYVYYGGPSGVDLLREDKLIASDGASEDRFGTWVSMAGDVNGDGYEDVLVSGYWDDDNGDESGSVYVFHGSPTGIDPTSEYKLRASDGAADDWFGVSISGTGDIDGDGYDDAVIGAYRDDDMGVDSGSAYVYYGSAAGLDPASEFKFNASDGANGGFFANAIDGPGDLNDDGFADVAVGAFGDDDNAPFAGAAYVYYGSAAGLDVASELKLIASDGAQEDWFGIDLAGVGDVNGDGVGDLVVGAYHDEDDQTNAVNSGNAYAYYGDCAPQTWFADVDGDGFGDPGDSVDDCSAPVDYVADGTDCDDTDPDVYPGATEIADDGIDQDCDGADWTGDPTDTPTTPDPTDPGTSDTDDAIGDTEDKSGGCGCATTVPSTLGWSTIIIVFLAGRRR